MIQIGRTYNLEVVKHTDFGLYLDAGNLGEILLPSKHAPDNLSIDDTVEVFLYLDSEDRPIATTQTPEAEVGEFAYLEVKDMTPIGAFLDWGLDKDEVDQRLSFGQSIQGYIKHIREDGKIDLSLKSGWQIRDHYSQMIQDYLRDHDGFAPVHDKSPPAPIFDLLGMSKGQFKKAIGGLYKQRVITIEKDGIRLV
ncbi:hypothetical protein CA13_18030 [Planctomycetes bacterium CA13]|uniref:S1 motif domain-containing protein n=1 Tax=Novipirellula herctigrandis TaxID=2527986 RepID=A0A5C5YZ62_9BACT|nr:hypothetical protein CA13_18030 [Planctomycetes bacterium CA13]